MNARQKLLAKRYWLDSYIILVCLSYSIRICLLENSQMSITSWVKFLDFKTLSLFIQDDCSGDYKRLLVGICGGHWLMHTFCCTETKNEESLFMNDDVHSSTNTLAECNCGNGEEILGTSIEQAVENDCWNYPNGKFPVGFMLKMLFENFACNYIIWRVWDLTRFIFVKMAGICEKAKFTR